MNAYLRSKIIERINFFLLYSSAKSKIIKSNLNSIWRLGVKLHHYPGETYLSYRDLTLFVPGGGKFYPPLDLFVDNFFIVGRIDLKFSVNSYN